MTTVKALKRESDEKTKKDVKIFNPDNKDFTKKFDGSQYTLKSGKTDILPLNPAHHLAKHLVDKILTKRKTKTNKEPERSKLLKTVLP